MCESDKIEGKRGREEGEGGKKSGGGGVFFFQSMASLN